MLVDRCELFEKTVESFAENKLGINKESEGDAKGGKATEFVNVAGEPLTIICCLAGGITIALSVATFGASSFAAAFLTGAFLAVKIVDKRKIQAQDEVTKNVVTRAQRGNVLFYLNCVLKDVAKELSRIFEFQLLQLENDEQVKILAECAIDLMFDLKKDDIFDRNTLLKKVLQDGKIKKKEIITKVKDAKWSAPNVFRKPGLRRIVFRKDGAKFEYLVKPEGACKPWKYGYRGQFLELKKYGSQTDNSEIPPMVETHSDDLCAVSCNECSPNYKSNPCGHYFGESDIDSKYTHDPRETLTYHPMHILVQCPNVLDCFQQLQEKKPSLASFLKSRLGLPHDHLVHPVYRPHSPRKVSDLQKSDLTGSDFSHSNFTESCLMNCYFTKCVMLFAKLTRAKFSGSKFCDTFISHSNLEGAVADRCEWTKTSLLYSRVDGAHVESVKATVGGNCFQGTNIENAITTNGNEEGKCK